MTTIEALNKLRTEEIENKVDEENNINESLSIDYINYLLDKYADVMEALS